MKGKTAAIIQARMGSNRLPGKVLKPLLGKPLLYRLIEQLRCSKLLDEIIVATSDQAADEPIRELCDDCAIKCFGGSADNVLKRYVDCVGEFGVDIIVRVTADNPLIDPEQIDGMIEAYRKDPRLDYINNIHRNGAVHGAGCELVTAGALKKALRLTDEEGADDKSFYREHVTIFIRRYCESFNILKYKPDEKLVRNDLSFTVDYPEDYSIVESIYRELYKEGTFIPAGEIVNFLDRHPEIAALNAHLHQPLPDW